MPYPRSIRMRQFIDQDEGGMASQSGIEVKFVKSGATIGYGATWQHVEPLQEGGGLGPTVGIDPAHDDIYALGPPLVGRFQHGVRFANTSRSAKEDLEFPTALLGLFLLDTSEQSVG